MLVAEKLANGEEPKESRLPAPHNRYGTVQYRDGVPPPGIFWLFAIGELVTNESQIPVLYEIASQIKCRTTLFRLANKSMSTIVSQVKVEVQIVSQTKWSQKEICRISGSLYS